MKYFRFLLVLGSYLRRGRRVRDLRDAGMEAIHGAGITCTPGTRPIGVRGRSRRVRAFYRGLYPVRKGRTLSQFLMLDTSRTAAMPT